MKKSNLPMGLFAAVCMVALVLTFYTRAKASGEPNACTTSYDWGNGMKKGPVGGEKKCVTCTYDAGTIVTVDGKKYLKKTATTNTTYKALNNCVGSSKNSDTCTEISANPNYLEPKCDPIMIPQDSTSTNGTNTNTNTNTNGTH